MKENFSEKEFLYVGYYYDTDNNFILKIGTTNNLERRAKEHTRNYHKAKKYTLPQESDFQYLWKTKLSKYNTLRYEDINRKRWKDADIGIFIRNDRFLLTKQIEKVTVKIRKTYEIMLA